MCIVYLRQNSKYDCLVHHPLTSCIRKATNSAGPGARQSTTDSAQHVDQIRTLYESKPTGI